MTLASDANFIQTRLPLGMAPMVSIDLAAVAVSTTATPAGRSLR